MWSPRIRTMIPLAAGLALAACASTSTKIVESWKAPEAGPLRFNKVLALAILDNESTRSRAEDALKANLQGVQAVQGYKLFAAGELADRAAVEERLRQQGFDGVVALSLAATEQKVGWTSSHVPLEAYAWYPTEQMAIETTVMVEIKIYSLSEKKVVWAGISESFNPKDTEDLISRIVEAAGKEMRRQGLLSA